MRINKLTDKKKEAYLDAIRDGLTKSEAAKNIGVDRSTIWAHTKDDPAFADAISDAELDACEKVENALFQACLKLNITAIIFFLTNRSPDRWKDRRNNKLEISSQQSGEQETLNQILARLKAREQAGDAAPCSG